MGKIDNLTKLTIYFVLLNLGFRQHVNFENRHCGLKYSDRFISQVLLHPVLLAYFNPS